MAGLRLYRAHDPQVLLRHAARGFIEAFDATRGVFPTPHYLLVLRRRAVRDDLFRMAARAGVRGWLDPPLAAVAELPRWLGTTGAKPLGDFERIALLSQIIRTEAADVLHRVDKLEDYIDAVDRLFGELIVEDVAPSQWAEALASRDGLAEFERRRDHELATCYASYRDNLAAAGRYDGRDVMAECARAIARNPSRLAESLRGRREIRFFGVSDVRGGWRLLLGSLLHSGVVERIAVYGSQPLALDGLPHEVHVLDEPASLAGVMFETDAPAAPPAQSLDVIEAPDVSRELEHVAVRIRQLVDGGMDPRHIAVMARHSRDYLDQAIAALERNGVPATARVRRSYHEVPVVQALRLVFEAEANNWPRRLLVELAQHPHLSTDLDDGVLDVLGYREHLRGLAAWQERAATLLREVDPPRSAPADGAQLSLLDAAGEQHDEDVDPIVPPAAVRRTIRGLRQLAAVTQPMATPKTLTDWLSWVRALIDQDPFGIADALYRVPEQRFDLARLDLAAWLGLRQVLEEWATAVRAWGPGGGHLTAAQFQARLTEIFRGDVALWTPCRGGVRVMEFFTGVYRHYRHVFVVGLQAEDVPRPPPTSPVLDEATREHLFRAGLPIDARQPWEERERDLFRAVVATASEGVTSSFSRQNPGGKEALPSVFLDELTRTVTTTRHAIPASLIRTPHYPIHDSEIALHHALAMMPVEASRLRGEPSPYNGLIDDPQLRERLATRFAEDRPWTPRQIEQYALCPWSFFATRLLRLGELEEPGEDIAPRVRGILFHDTLRTFYDRAVRRNEGKPVYLRAGDEEWIDDAVEAAVTEAFEAAAEIHWLGNPKLRDVRQNEFARTVARFVRYEIDQNERSFNNRTKNASVLRTGVMGHELKLGPCELEREGLRFSFRGRVDRVEHKVDERIEASNYLAAVDYKTTTLSAPAGGDPAGWDDGVVLQTPLYAYALQQQFPQGQVSRAEYRAIKSRAVVHSLQLVGVDRRLGMAHPNPAEQERMERALTAAASSVAGARAGQYPVGPAPSCGCPPHCPGWSICRVPGGPREKLQRR